MVDYAPSKPLRIELRIQTPHQVPVTGARVCVFGGDVEIHAVEADQVYTLALPRPGDYQVVIERFQVEGGHDHRTLRFTLFYVHTPEGPALRHLGLPEGERSRVDFIEGGGATFWIGVTLDYLWFTPIGYPPTHGNLVDLLVDGDAGWAAVARALRASQSTVHLTTWYYEATLELERPIPLTDPDQRVPYTIQDLLEARAAGETRVRFLAWDAPLLRQARALRRLGAAGGNNFEVLEQANPTTRPLFNAAEGGLINRVVGSFHIGSYHQKTIVVDGRVGFCGGMNMRENDWDSRTHRLFDARRCGFLRPGEHRGRVECGELATDHNPRHDFMARVEGPAVEHLERNFQERWNYMIDRQAPWSEHATEVADPPAQPPVRGGVQVQVVRTMPEPFTERGILDVHLRALRAARKLIYIEDQYFRSTHVSDAIADTVRSFPGIHVVAVTMRSQADDLLAGGWSREAFDRIRRRLPGLRLYSLMAQGVDRAGERHLVEIDNHAKLMIVDDMFLTVGSANINDRAFEYEGEINLAIVDSAQVKRARLDIWAEHLGDDPRLTGDIDGDVALWREHAAHNDRCVADRSLTPRSHVFSFEPRADRLRLTASDVL
jgi:phosphatidylserine/phosphatidylglycerophosphate/cardiolipin synthase-like enzyme